LINFCRRLKQLNGLLIIEQDKRAFQAHFLYTSAL